MKYEYILIRYGELSTKGKNRNKFIRNLRDIVKYKLKPFPGVTVEATRDRMYVHLHEYDHEPIVEALKEVFGIHTFSLALKTETKMEEIQKGALAALKETKQSFKTFKVQVHRPYKPFPYGTYESNREIGGYLLQNYEGLTVDVHNPDVVVRVEIRAEATYITCGEYKGQGGLPPGVSGKVLLLLSGGIDSPVAGYLTMKRGTSLEAIHFYSPPYTSERAKQKVLDLSQQLTRYCKRVKVHIIPFTDLQKAIFKEVPSDYSMTVMRRMMLRIAEKVAEERNCLALVNGESLGQVASQTLNSMHVINDVTNMPIIRPLITMDKLEILDVAHRIDTYEISIRPFEDCCTIFTAPNPSTKPKLERTERFEAKFDWQTYVDEAVKNMETISVSEKGFIVESRQEGEDVEEKVEGEFEELF